MRARDLHAQEPRTEEDGTHTQARALAYRSRTTPPRFVAFPCRRHASRARGVQPIRPAQTPTLPGQVRESVRRLAVTALSTANLTTTAPPSMTLTCSPDCQNPVLDAGRTFFFSFFHAVRGRKSRIRQFVSICFLDQVVSISPPRLPLPLPASGPEVSRTGSRTHTLTHTPSQPMYTPTKSSIGFVSGGRCRCTRQMLNDSRS